MMRARFFLFLMKRVFSVVWRACRAVAGLASLLGVLLKKGSNINQKTPPVRK
jgi:hypothetical protein